MFSFGLGFVGFLLRTGSSRKCLISLRTYKLKAKLTFCFTHSSTLYFIHSTVRVSELVLNFNQNPVQYMTWTLMEVPCYFVSQIDGNLVQIDTKFHVYSMSFIQILFVFHAGTWHGFWTSESHEISMAFGKKTMGFPSDLVSFSNQTKLPSKRHEKIHVTFFTGMLIIVNTENWPKLILI